jgi:hypothetical protein
MSAGDDETVTADGSRELDPAPAPIQRAGPYRLIDVLGAGGMGTVWRARDEVLLRDVAVKRLPPARAGDADARARMLREARAQAALAHANVCTILQAGEDDDGVWIAMELLAGPTLAEKQRDAPLPIAQVAAWGAEIARALAAAHARGLVHRDLKPGNVMLDAAGHVKVTDFGLVKLVAADAHGDSATSPALDTTLTREGAIIGSPRYMSPEQARGDDVGPPSDIFSLGIVLYELASGARAFAGASAMETIAAIIKDTPRPLREVAPSAPPAFAGLVHRCLARDPAARPTATELADALAQPMAPARRRRIAIALGGAAVLAAVAIVAYVASRGSSPDDAPAATPSVAAKPPATAPAITIADDNATIHATYDRSGRRLFFAKDEGRFMRVWRSTDRGAPEPVPDTSDLGVVACCWNNQIIGLDTAQRARAIDPESLKQTPAPLFDPLGGSGTFAISADETWAAGTFETKVVLLHLVGDHRQVEVPTRGTALGAHWSPSGHRVVYRSNSTTLPNDTIELIDVDRDPTRSVEIAEPAVINLGGLLSGVIWTATDRVVFLDTLKGKPSYTEVTLGDRGDVRASTSRPLGEWRQPLATNGRDVAYLEVHATAAVCVGDIDHQHAAAPAPLSVTPNYSTAGWTPDGRLVMTLHNPSAKADEVAVLSPGGAPRAVVVANPGVRNRAVGVTGERILFLRFPKEGKPGLWIVGLDGSGERRLLDVSSDTQVACGTNVCVMESFAANEVRLVDLAHGTADRVIQRGEQTAIVGVSSDDRFVAGAAGGTLWIYDLRTGQTSTRTSPGLRAVQSIAFYDDDLILTDNNYAPGEHALLRLRKDGTIDVIASDGKWYYLPLVDRVRHRLAVTCNGFTYALRTGPIDAPSPVR